MPEPIEAEEARRLGLVNWVVPAAELETRLHELGQRLSAGATGAYGRSKALLRSAGLHTLAEHLGAERQAFLEGVAGPEFREGAAAFLEKRAPDFTTAALQADRKTLT